MQFQSLVANRNRSVARSRAWQVYGNWTDLRTTLLDGVREQRLLPLAIFDPAGTSHDGAPFRLTTLVLGDTREDVAQYERFLLQQGWK